MSGKSCAWCESRGRNSTRLAGRIVHSEQSLGTVLAVLSNNMLAGDGGALRLLFTAVVPAIGTHSSGDDGRDRKADDANGDPANGDPENDDPENDDVGDMAKSGDDGGDEKADDELLGDEAGSAGDSGGENGDEGADKKADAANGDERGDENGDEKGDDDENKRGSGSKAGVTVSVGVVVMSNEASSVSDWMSSAGRSSKVERSRG